MGFNRTVCQLSALALMALSTRAAAAQAPGGWKQHDMSRPKPPVVQPGTPSLPDRPGRAPSDAIVLFDGHDLSRWVSMDGSPAKWTVKDGAMESVPGSGYIRTLRNFGDCQLHVEFATPARVTGQGQGRGNSGVFLMTLYEVQVLDSYRNDTYADGQAGAIYGQYPPLANASLPPGQWQTYDIVFIRPRFNADGSLRSPAYFTVFHNGVLIQNHVAVQGPTEWLVHTPYKAHPDKMPIALQDHGNPVRYRNIWIRELEGGPAEYTYSDAWLARLTGIYQADPSLWFTVQHRKLVFGEPSVPYGVLTVLVQGKHWMKTVQFYAGSKTRFFAKTVDAEIEFHADAEGHVTGLSFFIGREERHAERKSAGK